MIRSLTIDDTDLADGDQNQFGKMLQLITQYCFPTIDEVVFLNQPSDRMNINLMTMMFGIQLMLRDQGEGQYRTRTKFIIKPNQTIQEQTLVRDE